MVNMKVLILADTHFDDGSRHLHYPASKQAIRGFWRWLKKKTTDVDLISICGDISVKGTTHLGELQYVKKKFDEIKIPYIPVAGNHDLCATKGMEKRYPDLEEYEYVSLEETNYYKAFGEDGVRYSRVFNGIRFIGFAVRNEDPDGQLPWLLEQLKKPEPKLVFGHYPLVPSRSSGYCKEWDYSRIDKIIPNLIEIIGNEEHKVLAYFCGHQHINSIVPMGSTYQIETASTVLTTTSYRIMEITDSEVQITTHRLPYIDGYAGDLTLPDRSVDAEHPTVHEYHYGNTTDLDITIQYDKI